MAVKGGRRSQKSVMKKIPSKKNNRAKTTISRTTLSKTTILPKTLIKVSPGDNHIGVVVHLLPLCSSFLPFSPSSRAECTVVVGQRWLPQGLQQGLWTTRGNVWISLHLPRIRHASSAKDTSSATTKTMPLKNIEHGHSPPHCRTTSTTNTARRPWTNATRHGLGWVDQSRLQVEWRRKCHGQPCKMIMVKNRESLSIYIFMLSKDFVQRFCPKILSKGTIPT